MDNGGNRVILPLNNPFREKTGRQWARDTGQKRESGRNNPGRWKYLSL